jgi:hypothetical protein
VRQGRDSSPRHSLNFENQTSRKGEKNAADVPAGACGQTKSAGGPFKPGALCKKALESLVANGFVWRSSRGVYALDDVTAAEFCYDDAVQDALLRELDPHAAAK